MAEPRIVTFGCRLNAFESEVMRARLGAGGSETIVVNTCAVTGEAVRQARQAIRKLRREHPNARLIVTGCAVETERATFANLPGVDAIVANGAKLDARALRGEDVSAVEDRLAAAPYPDGPALEKFGARTRAFVQIQQGCDHRCTFCIIPYARGPARSVPLGAIAEQVRALARGGAAEAVLTGVDISSWGRDLPGQLSLGDLVRRLLKAVPELKRLRLSSLDPGVWDEPLFRALAEEERLMPHLHLSLQALDDMVLKRMKRRHDRAQGIAFAARARQARPEIALGADLIAGFPTETEAMFANTLAGVAEAGLSFLHVFPYSARTGTPAARMPQVPMPVRKARAKLLRAAGEAALGRLLDARVGATADVLVETDGEGRAPDYAPVRLAFDAPAGTLVRARFAAVAAGRLVGERAA